MEDDEALLGGVDLLDDDDVVGDGDGIISGDDNGLIRGGAGLVCRLVCGLICGFVCGLVGGLVCRLVRGVVLGAVSGAEDPANFELVDVGCIDARGFGVASVLVIVIGHGPVCRLVCEFFGDAAGVGLCVGLLAKGKGAGEDDENEDGADCERCRFSSPACVIT